MGISSNGAKVFVLVALMVSTIVYGGDFIEEFEKTFGDHRVRTYGRGNKVLSLSLDKASGSGFKSRNEYLYGRFDMQMKLVAGNSAGSVTTLYLSSEGATHDEIDFEFLGNVSGQPYTLHTNVFSQGKGGREQQFHLWFDPTANFHTYSIVWNPKLIMFLVDNTPIRVFRNHEDIGVPFPKSQPMRIYSSLWNADQWATQGGLVKADWSLAPFTAYYRNFNIDATPVNYASTHSRGHGSWRNHDLDAWGRRRIRWVHRYHKVYDYCKDYKRYTQGAYPAECRRPQL